MYFRVALNLNLLKFEYPESVLIFGNYLHGLKLGRQCYVHNIYTELKAITFGIITSLLYLTYVETKRKFFAKPLAITFDPFK